MKKLKNTTTEIKLTEDTFTTFADLAKACVNVTPEGGFTPTEMQSRLNVLNRLEGANGEIKLEDAESETLKACVKSMKWAIMHKDLIKFVNEVEKL